MACEAGQCSKTSTPYGIFILKPLLEGWPTKAKEAPSPHEVRLDPLCKSAETQVCQNPKKHTSGYSFFKGSLSYNNRIKNIVNLSQHFSILIKK